MSVAMWIALALWNAVIIYVFVAVRKIMARNNQVNSNLTGREAGPITSRGVSINRIALLVLLAASNWAILHYGAGVLA